MHDSRLNDAFSLIEIVLALGVISVAMVGIMGLFPVALRSAVESQRETRATLIAQQVFSDLRAGTGTNRLVIRAGSPSPLTVNLSQQGSNSLAFDNNGRFTNGTATFILNLSVDTNTGVANLSRVQADVVTPAAAPAAARTTNTFVTLMNY